MRVNVCVPYLLMVTRFFLNAIQTAEDTHSVPPPAPTKPTKYQEDSAQSGLPQPPGTQGDEPSTPVLNGTTFTVSGRFKQPEIVLFAEPTQKHSRVLVCKVCLLVSLLPDVAVRS